MTHKKVLTLTCTMLLALGILAGCGNSTTKDTAPAKKATTESSEKPAAAEKLSQFTTTPLSGEAFTPEDLKKADVTMVNFWATTCGPCIHEMPQIAALAKEAPANVKVVSFCVDGQKNGETAKQVLADAGFTGPAIIAADGDFKNVMSTLRYTPTTLLFNADGEIIGKPIVGGKTKDDFKNAINDALKQMGKAEMA